MFEYVMCGNWLKTYKLDPKYSSQYFGFFSLNYEKEWEWTSRDCKGLTEILLKLKELNGKAKNEAANNVSCRVSRPE